MLKTDNYCDRKGSPTLLYIVGATLAVALVVNFR